MLKQQSKIHQQIKNLKLEALKKLQKSLPISVFSNAFNLKLSRLVLQKDTEPFSET